MEPEGSLPYSQEPATCPYPEPDQSTSCPPSNLSKMVPYTGTYKYTLWAMYRVLY